MPWFVVFKTVFSPQYERIYRSLNVIRDDGILPQRTKKGVIMSFTIKVTTAQRTSFPLFNVTLGEQSKPIDVLIDVLNIVSLGRDNNGTVECIATIDGISGGVIVYPFVYSGTGHPLDDAEEQVKAMLTTK